jgi:hypothetical protein
MIALDRLSLLSLNKPARCSEWARVLELGLSFVLFFTTASAQDAPRPPFDNVHLATAPEPNSSRFIPVRADSGAVSFDGLIERVELDREYEYRVAVAVTFHPERDEQHSRSIHLRGVYLLALQRPAGVTTQQVNVLNRVLHQSSGDIDVDLTSRGETRWLPATTSDRKKPR